MRFDWTTLLLQTVNLLVLVWLLQRFLFRPVMAIIAERRRAADALLADAEAARDTARAEAERIASRRQSLAAEGDHILADAHASAEAERTELLAQARQEAARTQQATETTLDQERARQRRALEAEARQLAVTIAARLLARVPPQAATAALLEMLDTWLATLPTADLTSLTGPREPLEVATAAALDASAQAACTAMLRRRLGDGLRARFITDPSLIAGIELRGPHARLRNTWRADLDRIAEELEKDDQRLATCASGQAL
jgi:F-type H+-transporting ATPase subunit b